MALFKVPDKKENKTAKKESVRASQTLSNKEQEVVDLIKRRRLQMLIHSCLYYQMDLCIWTDSEFNEKARELADLQNGYPELAKKVKYAKEFQDWDGSTGFHLPIKKRDIMVKAQEIYRIHLERGK